MASTGAKVGIGLGIVGALIAAGAGIAAAVSSDKSNGSRGPQQPLRGSREMRGLDFSRVAGRKLGGCGCGR
jgi:NAD(P)-dependent dehydrogenase (short-subunit alcohol dehydrogenase family)